MQANKLPSNEKIEQAKTKEKWTTVQPIKRDYFQFEQERDVELKTKVEQESEWPKFLGDLTLKAFVIGTLTRKVRVGKY